MGFKASLLEQTVPLFYIGEIFKSQSFYKCLLNILKACRDKPYQIPKAPGFNVVIFLYFTMRFVDKFFSEPDYSAIYKATLNASANQKVRNRCK